MSNIEIIQELYRSFREKDYDAFLQVCARDLQWIQNEGFPRGQPIKVQKQSSIESLRHSTTTGKQGHLRWSSGLMPEKLDPCLLFKLV